MTILTPDERRLYANDKLRGRTDARSAVLERLWEAYVALEANDRLCRAFLEGAKWWEWAQNGATVGQSDQHAVMDEAEARLARGTLGASEEEFLATLKKEAPPT